MGLGFRVGLLKFLLIPSPGADELLYISRNLHKRPARTLIKMCLPQNTGHMKRKF